MTNSEIRQRYREQIFRITELNAEWIKQGLSVKERAEAAWRHRRAARLAARAMMSDRREAELLRARDLKIYGNPDGPTYEFLIAKMIEAGLAGNAVYEAIIAGSIRTDADTDNRFG